MKKKGGAGSGQTLYMRRSLVLKLRDAAAKRFGVGSQGSPNWTQMFTETGISTSTLSSKLSDKWDESKEGPEKHAGRPIAVNTLAIICKHIESPTLTEAKKLCFSLGEEIRTSRPDELLLLRTYQRIKQYNWTEAPKAILDLVKVADAVEKTSPPADWLAQDNPDLLDAMIIAVVNGKSIGDVLGRHQKV